MKSIILHIEIMHIFDKTRTFEKDQKRSQRIIRCSMIEYIFKLRNSKKNIWNFGIGTSNVQLKNNPGF